MAKKNLLLKIFGLLLIIFSFIFNLYSVFRIIGVLGGILLFLLGCFLYKKINVFKIILSLLILFIISYGIDCFFVYLKREPVFAYKNKSSDDFYTYDSILYRIYSCSDNKTVDYFYQKNYVCDNHLKAIEINTFLDSFSSNYQKYYNKFITVTGKVSEVFGNDYIYLQPYKDKINGLLGEITFNQNVTLKIENNQQDLKFYNNYEIYDNVIVTGKIVKKDNNTIIMNDVKIDNINNYDNFAIDVKKTKECKNNINLLTTADYRYFTDCIDNIYVIYDEFTKYDLRFSLETKKITFDKLVSDKEYTENEEKELYKFSKYNILKCKNKNAILIGNTKLSLKSKFCENISD